MKALDDVNKQSSTLSSRKVLTLYVVDAVLVVRSAGGHPQRCRGRPLRPGWQRRLSGR